MDKDGSVWMEGSDPGDLWTNIACTIQVKMPNNKVNLASGVHAHKHAHPITYAPTHNRFRERGPTACFFQDFNFFDILEV